MWLQLDAQVFFSANPGGAGISCPEYGKLVSLRNQLSPSIVKYTYHFKFCPIFAEDEEEITLWHDFL